MLPQIECTPEELDPKRAARELFMLALPIMGSNIARMMIGFIDFYMVSKLGSTDAQAAIFPATLALFTILCVGNGIAQSSQTFAAQADGRGEPRQAAAYAWQTIYLSLLLGALVWPLSRFLPGLYDQAAAWAGHTEPVRKIEIAFMSVAIWSFAPSMITSGLEGFFLGIQKPRISVIAVVASLVATAAGNYALIFGHWGFPAMGVVGSGIATVLGWWVRASILIVAFLSETFDTPYGTRSAWRLDLPKIGATLRVGSPMALQWLIDIGAWLVFVSYIMAKYGTHAMAASNVVIQYLHLGFMPALGIGFALRSMVGFAIGERKQEKAVVRVRVAFWMTVAYMGLVGLLFIFGRYWLMWRLTPDPAVVAIGVQILLWAAGYQIFDAMYIAFSNALMGAGDTRWQAFAMVGCCWGLFICGGLAIARWAPHWGVTAPWAMAAAYITTLGLLVRWRFRSGAWRKIELFKDEGARAETAAAATAPGH